MPTYKELEKEPIIQDIRKAVNKQKEKIYRGYELYAYNHYFDKGKNEYYVQEFEDIKLKKLKEKRKKMPKKRVEVRLSKNFNVVVIESDEIFDDAEFALESEICFREAERIINMMPEKPYGETALKQTDKKTIVNKAQYNQNKKPQSQSGRVSIQDITTQHGSAKQHGFLVQGINKGLFTLEQVNDAPDYNTISEMVSQFFKSK